MSGSDGVRVTTDAIDRTGIFGVHNGSGTVPKGSPAGSGSGIWGHTTVEKGTGVYGTVEPGLTKAAGITGVGVIAGRFFGNVIVTGDVQLVNGDVQLNGADLAEHFDIRDDLAVEPGTVMVLDTAGGVRACNSPYDRKVAGVISGAGEYRPGLILDRRSLGRALALVGKVYCKVDATFAPIQVGDLLTTSATPGHAMKATDQVRAFGAVLGKAIEPMADGTGLLRVLVFLH